MSLLKKIFFLSVLICGLSLLFWGVYRLAFEKSTVSNNSKTPNPTASQTPPTQAPTTAAKITALTSDAVLAPTLTADQKNIEYYSAETGQVFKIDLDGGSKTTISSQNIAGLVKVLWSPDKNAVISQIQSGDQNNFYFYSYDTNKGIQLKKNLDTIVWSATGQKIFYKYYDPKTKQRTLNISDPDGSQWTKLSDLNYRDISIASIPQSASVSFWNTGDAYSQTDFESVPVIGGDKKTIYNQKFGADYLWNATGNKILVSSTDVKGGYKMQLATLNYNGGEYNNLDIPTFISKCVWSRDGKTVFYALSGGIPDNSVLPNDYKNGKFQTMDTFWKVDTTTGKKTRLVDTGEINNKFDATQLFLNQDESFLFFVNKIDGKLYKINL